MRCATTGFKSIVPELCQTCCVYMLSLYGPNIFTSFRLETFVCMHLIGNLKVYPSEAVASAFLVSVSQHRPHMLFADPAILLC